MQELELVRIYSLFLQHVKMNKIVLILYISLFIFSSTTSASKLFSDSEINEMISESGGFRYANDKLNEFSEKAIDAIQGYEESEVKKSLTQLVSFNINRKM